MLTFHYILVVISGIGAIATDEISFLGAGLIALGGMIDAKD